MDWTLAAQQLVRALRGKRSQTALSRRLGYRTNVLYLWESGRGGPTAVRFLLLAKAVGVDLHARFEAFYRARPGWLERTDPGSREGIGAFLRDLQGKTSVQALASVVGASRFALSRWLKAEADPQLADLLAVVEASSHRALDFVACFVDPSALPALRADWERLQNARRAAYELPWSHAILRTLELERARKLRRHPPGWFASELGIDIEEERRCLALLERTGQIERRGGKWRLGRAITTDTRQDPNAARNLKAFWFDVGRQRFENEATGVFSYNLFGVSARDFGRLMDLQRAYFRELRSIVAQSEPVETVGVVNLQLFTLHPNGRQP